MGWEAIGLAAAYLGVMNIATYAAFALDKRRSVERAWRLREVSLLRLALFGGWPGAKLAQWRLRHKTRKQPFARILNLIGALQLVLALALAATAAGWTGAAARWLGGEGWAGIGLTLFEPGPEPEPERVMPRRFGPGS